MDDCRIAEILSARSTEMTMDMKDMVAALAGMPEEQRRTMMAERLAMFAEMPDTDREGAMRQMSEAVQALPSNDQRALIKTRTEILADLPEATRQKLMGTHMKAMMAMPPEAMMAEMKTVESITPQLTKERQAIVMKMMESMPMPETAGAMAGMQPGQSGGASLAPRRRAWWKFW
jgi:Protein of unknown function (DUF3106)